MKLTEYDLTCFRLIVSRPMTMVEVGMIVGPDDPLGRWMPFSRRLVALRAHGYVERGQGRGVKNQILRLTDKGRRALEGQ